MDTATMIQTAKLIAVPAPFFLAGYSYSFSQNAVKQLYDVPPKYSTPAFAGVFHTGTWVMAPGAAITAASAAYLAYVLPAQRSSWAFTMTSVFSILPWTALVMKPSSIDRLLAISQSEKLQEKTAANLEYRQLVQKWVLHNYVRAMFLFVGGVAALRATVA